MSDNQTCDWLPRKCKTAEKTNSACTVTLTEVLDPASYAKPVISEAINHKKIHLFSVSCHSKPAPSSQLLPNESVVKTNSG